MTKSAVKYGSIKTAKSEIQDQWPKLAMHQLQQQLLTTLHLGFCVRR